MRAQLTRRLPNRRMWIILAMLLFFLAAASPDSQAQEEKDWRFGVVEAYTARNAARELKIGWTRLRYHWADVQAGGPTTWTPEVTDEQLAEQLAEEREVIGLLIGIPDWARDENDLPRGLWLDHNDPDNLWAVFVREAAGRYAGRIDHWIIWNEPDIDKSEVAHSWDGSVDDFYQLQRVAYLAAKEANPQAVIHLPAFTYWADFDAGREQYMVRLLDRIVEDPNAAAHNYYFDIASAHLYFQPDQIYELLGKFQQMMRERGIAKPIWLVETNAPPYDDPDWIVPVPALAVTSTEQAAFMPQALAAALAGGAERIGVYKLRDTPGDRDANPEPFGLLRLDGSRRVAYTTLREAIRLMQGTNEAVRERWDDVGMFRLEQADRVTTVLFSRLPDSQRVQIDAIAPTARLVDMWGQETFVEAEDGIYTIELQQARCTQTIGDYCMIGGTVLYLIQARDGGFPSENAPPLLPPTASPYPQPPASRTPEPRPTPQPSATLTKTLSPLPTVTMAATRTLTLSTAAESTTVAVHQEAQDVPAPTSAASSIADETTATKRAPLLIALPLLFGVLLLAFWIISRRWRS